MFESGFYIKEANDKNQNYFRISLKLQESKINFIIIMFTFFLTCCRPVAADLFNMSKSKSFFSPSSNVLFTLEFVSDELFVLRDVREGISSPILMLC